MSGGEGGREEDSRGRGVNFSPHLGVQPSDDDSSATGRVDATRTDRRVTEACQPLSSVVVC
jgi:hypothetical protein